MRFGSTVRSERSMAAFGTAGSDPPAGRNEADAVEFTCSAREKCAEHPRYVPHFDPMFGGCAVLTPGM